jgi:hypothetical protein
MPGRDAYLDGLLAGDQRERTGGFGRVRWTRAESSD